MDSSDNTLDLTYAGDRAAMMERIGWDVGAIKRGKVMVIGAGALGNEVLKNLALIGVGHILLIDFDTIEKSNLARSVLYREADCTGEKNKVDIAAMRVKELNGEVKLMTINGDIGVDVGLGIFRRMDVIIGCVDNRLARLRIDRNAHALGKTWVDGGIEDMGGQVSVYRPGVSSYECALGPQAWANINFRMGCTDRAMRNASNGLANTTPILASIISAMEVQEAMKVLGGEKFEPFLLAGKQFYYEGLSNTYEVIPHGQVREDCPGHIQIEEVIEAPELGAGDTLTDLFAWLGNYFENTDFILQLYHPLVLSIHFEGEDRARELIIPRPHLSKDHIEKLGPSSGVTYQLEVVEEIDSSFPHMHLRLLDIGIPKLQIIKIISKGKEHFVELSADLPFLHFS
ncbi:MAG: ThiF family adenylyltransferase [Bacteroidota bacterium]